MATRKQYEIPKRYNNIAFGLMAVGIIAIIILLISDGLNNGPVRRARFLASLLQNSVYFLLVTNAAMFFICATTLAWARFQMAFRRVTEAISTCVPIIGVIAGVVLLSVCFSDNHTIYHWADTDHLDPIL